MATAKTRGAGGRLSRSETVTVRLDPRLNYLCELTARSQRRTKSSFIESIIEEKINSTSFYGRPTNDAYDCIGDNAEKLWHVREYERLIGLAFLAQHLLTYEEQEIWATICEHGAFWKGRWKDANDDEQVWAWDCEEKSLIKTKVVKHWDDLIQVADGAKDSSALPAYQDRREKPQSSSTADLDDEIPF